MTVAVDGGEIRPEVLYHSEKAMRILGWGRHAWRVAKQKGMKVRHVGNRCYVRGEEIIKYIEEHGKQHK